MGAGKTAVGRELAKRLNRCFTDLDQFIEESEAKSVSEIFDTYGEKYFRKLEKQYVQACFKDEPIVLALGGGALTTNGILDFLKTKGTLVFIDPDTETIKERLKRNKKRPKLLDENGNMMPDKELDTLISSLLEKRKPVYQQADFIYKPINASKTAQAERLLRQLKEHVK